MDYYDQKDPGGSILLYQKSWHPNQTRFHTQPLTPKQKADCVAAGYPHIMYRKSPGIGKNKISEYFKQAAAILGMADPSRFTGHALRSKYCTSIANAKDLNIQEKISATRHGSVNALVGYIEPTTNSKCRKLESK